MVLLHGYFLDGCLPYNIAFLNASFIRFMPDKHDAAIRHQIPKITCKKTNRVAYEARLGRRYGVSLWITDTAIANATHWTKKVKN